MTVPSPTRPPKDTRSDASAPAPAPPRRAPAVFAALRTGVTAFAALAGLACFFFLAQAGITGVLAVVAGLIFALLVRVAALSLLREWLVAAARRRMPPSVPPSVPPTSPPAPRR